MFRESARPDAGPCVGASCRSVQRQASLAPEWSQCQPSLAGVWAFAPGAAGRVAVSLMLLLGEKSSRLVAADFAVDDFVVLCFDVVLVERSLSVSWAIADDVTARAAQTRSVRVRVRACMAMLRSSGNSHSTPGHARVHAGRSDGDRHSRAHGKRRRFSHLNSTSLTRPMTPMTMIPKMIWSVASSAWLSVIMWPMPLDAPISSATIT